MFLDLHEGILTLFTERIIQEPFRWRDGFRTVNTATGEVMESSP